MFQLFMNDYIKEILKYTEIYPGYMWIYDINKKYQAAAGPAQAKGRVREFDDVYTSKFTLVS